MIRKEHNMAVPYYDYKEYCKWRKFCESWMQWRIQKPSLMHPIKYIKWYRSEPKYGKEMK